jgi:DNA gyrase subunit A
MGRQAYGVWGIRMEKGDYLVGMATTPKPDAAPKPDADKPPATDAQVADLVPEKGRLILSVTENGYGKRTAADEYRLQGRGGSGVINVKTTERNGKVVGIAQVTEKSEVMLISQYGKIIRMDSTTIRESGRVAAAVVLAPGQEPTNGTTLLQ